MTSFLSIAVLMLAGAMAQSVTPSNATLPASQSNAKNIITLSGGMLLEKKAYAIAPLTESVGRGGNPTTAAVRSSFE
jgi:hypothetical protein